MRILPYKLLNRMKIRCITKDLFANYIAEDQKNVTGKGVVSYTGMVENSLKR